MPPSSSADGPPSIAILRASQKLAALPVNRNTAPAGGKDDGPAAKARLHQAEEAEAEDAGPANGGGKEMVPRGEA